MQHQARKRFGQNFLHDPQVIQRIIHAINPQVGENFVEIGPGMGALTEPLLQRLGTEKPLNVIELDRDLARKLEEHYGDKLNIHQCDALKFDFSQLSQTPQKLRIIGNLPYNISTPLLFHLLAQVTVVKDMVFMLQKEVVDRIIANAGDNAYGRLSVVMAYHCHREKLFNVGAGAFNPAPKVDSSILYLRPHDNPPVDVGDFLQFKQLVTMAFANRRKTLRNNLKKCLSAEQIEQVGIDPSQRAERLSLEDFARLSCLL